MRDLGHCKSCKWWERFESEQGPTENDFGLCHYNPPVVTENDSPPWPITNEADWCKERSPRES